MQRLKIVAARTLLIAALATGSFLLGRTTADMTGSRPESPAAPDTARRILYWQAPMNPEEIYDSPGKSVMGMDLVPVYADMADTSASGVVTADPYTVQHMGIRTTHARRRDFSRMIRTVGIVEFNEESLHVVNAKVSGWIEKLHVEFAGETVRAGDSLVEIYSPELVTTQQEYLLALQHFSEAEQSSFPAMRENAAQLLAAAQQRLEYWDFPLSEIHRLAQTGEVSKSVLLTAPASGTVTEKNAIEGAYLQAGEDLFHIADLSSVWVHASLHDHDLPWIAEGQTASMELTYLPGRTFSGRVSYIYPFTHEESRDVLARLVFKNPGQELKPGMYVTVQLHGRVFDNAIVIPSEAVIHSGARYVVFVQQAPGKFEPREIHIGEEGGTDDSHVRVIAGLIEGEAVVTSAQFMLDSESRLQEAMRKLLPAQPEPVMQPTPHQHEPEGPPNNR